MRGNTFSAIYVINIVIHSFFSVLISIGLSALIGWLLVSNEIFGNVIYIPLILVGTIVGLFSMFRTIIISMKSLERIENDRKNSNEKLK